MKLAEKILSEQFDVKDAIKSLIDTNFSANDKEKGKAAQLFRGLLFSNDTEAVEFVKKLDKMLSDMEG